MGTIADKLNYLNTTKSQIKTALTNKGVSISDTDTFRSYVDKINGITVSKTQTKTQSITENKTYTIKPDSGYTGLTTVTVTPATETKTVTLTSSGTTTVTPSSGKVGLTSVAITPATQTKSTTITSNGTTTITPDSGKVGLTSVSITTNVMKSLTGVLAFSHTAQYGAGNVTMSKTFTFPANIKYGVLVLEIHQANTNAISSVAVSGSGISSSVTKLTQTGCAYNGQATIYTAVYRILLTRTSGTAAVTCTATVVANEGRAIFGTLCY